MLCPHCGGLIEIVAGQLEPDPAQAELPLIVELRRPTKHAKKVIDTLGSEIHAGAGRARQHNSDYKHHDHVHGLSDSSFRRKHEHDHETEPKVGGARPSQTGEPTLTSAQQDLLNQIEELIADENRTYHFLPTWILRIREHPNAVFAAIGETRTAKREGRIRKSVGGLLNWNFERFREDALRRRIG
jgi:hypothetical protein